MPHDNQATRQTALTGLLDQTTAAFAHVLDTYQASPVVRELGRINSVGSGIARVGGLSGVQSEELVQFATGLLGLALSLGETETGVILLGDDQDLRAGVEVRRTGRVADMPVGDNLLGRVVDAVGHPLDDRGPLNVQERRHIEQPAPPIMARAPVSEPLQTGIKVIDALIPIGRGQRELIVGDRQTGKTALALDTIINQRDKEVLCVYCSIGQRSGAVARFINDLRENDVMGFTTVVVATGDMPPGLQFLAPYAATAIAEHYMHQGADVLVVYDDLTRHARAYRELSLLLRRPPGREAYPGDIFYVHSRLLERATHLKDGGSMTALPIVETQAQNISAYIPTNLISITDGQIYLSPDLFQKGILPAVDIGRSVSRVGGKAQFLAYRAVAGDLRLTYSQFEELEAFSRFGTRLDQETRRTITRGRRVREVLKQPQYQPMPVAEQIAVLFAVTEGLFDDLALDQVGPVSDRVRRHVREKLAALYQRIQQGEDLTDEDRGDLRSSIRRLMARKDGEQ
ncbi:MAG: alternate F1F0 ATPase, F1 subunit alpha [Chloroflexi bacterium]|nr:alternate F1F0 ATPase, F1 subunit alpha [Chloroflexota bacterium]